MSLDYFLCLPSSVYCFPPQTSSLIPLLIATGEAIPLRGLEGVPGLPGAPQDEARLTRKFDACVRAQSCLTLCNTIDCSPPDFSVHGILQSG